MGWIPHLFLQLYTCKKKTRWRKWARLGKYAWETESSQETRNWCTAQSVNIFERLFKGQWERSKSKALATKSNYPISVSRTHILGKIGFLQCQTCKYIHKHMRYTCNISKLIKDHPVFSWGSRFPQASVVGLPRSLRALNLLVVCGFMLFRGTAVHVGPDRIRIRA